MDGNHIERPELWGEVERTAAIWSESLGVSCAVIPLERLQPLWNSHSRLAGQDRIRLETLSRENLELRWQLKQLQKQFDQVTTPAVRYGGVERRKSN